MKAHSVYALVCSAVLLVIACSKNPTPPGQGGGGGNPPPNPPTITGISPDSGYKNTAVTINGTNFGTDTTQIKVFFNGAAGVLQSLTNTKIVALVPAKAGTGAVTVALNSKVAQGPVFNYLPSLTVTTIAGNGQAGYVDATGSAARFGQPRGVAVDTAGNVYVADFDNRTIRVVTPAGVVTTLAGDPQSFNHMVDGTGVNASFDGPNSIAWDLSGNKLYVVDISSVGGYNNQIRTVSLSGVVVSPFDPKFGYVDGSIGAALFYQPAYVATDNLGNTYVADEGNYRMRKISASGVVSTVSGNGTAGTTDGPANGATFSGHAWGIAIDTLGDVFYTDVSNHSIRKIAGGNVSTLAGGSNTSGGYADGTGKNALFSSPTGIVADKAGNLYVSDLHNQCIRKITPAGVVTTLVGVSGQPGLVDGDASVARFQGPFGIAIDRNGNLYVADFFGNAIRKISFD